VKERGITMTGPSPTQILAGLKTQTRRLVNLERLYVTLPAPVRSDWPDRGTVAKPGRYRAQLNPHGAVFIFVGGEKLGVKPGEFNFVCPYADGETHLGDYGGERKAWTITPRASRLWVREEHARFSVGEGMDRPVPECVAYRATHDGGFDYINTRGETIPLRVTKWTSARFMPRWASRMLLDVASVRLERVQAIDEHDARAEGIELGTPVPTLVNGTRGEVTYFEARTAFAHLWCGIHGPEAWKANPWVWAVTFALVDADERAA
jgi:hypothetical protein